MTFIASGLTWIAHGGFMMIPLLISAFVALTVIFERLYVFKTRFSLADSTRLAIQKRIRASDLRGAQELLAPLTGPTAEVLKAGLANFALTPLELEKALQNEAKDWIPLLEKRIDILDTVITAAPLMGLLGTITGMMSSFKILSESGVNEPNAITGGVAEALTATATGLVIALICLLFYNYFNSKIRVLIHSIEHLSGELLEAKLRQTTAQK